MRYIAAYLLASLGGSSNPNANDIKKILGSVGVDCEDARVEQVLKSLKGKSLDELIAEGSSKLASMPAGGAVAVSAGGGGGDGGAAAADDKKEDKKAKKEESEEEDEDMGFGLFD